MAYNFYLISLATAAFFVFFQKKFISPVSLFFLGCFLYGLPLLYGKNFFITSYLSYNEFIEEIPDKIYYIYSLSMFFVCCISFVSNYWEEGKIKLDNFKSKFVALFLTQVLFFALFMVKIKLNFLIKDKHFLVEHLSVFYSVASVSTVLTILAFFFRKQRESVLFLVPSVLFLIVDLIMGYRTTTFLMICSLGLMISHRHLPNLNVFNRILASTLGLIVLLSAFVYKPVYYSVKNGGLENIKFTSDTAFVGSEPFVIMGVFSKLLDSNYTVRLDQFAYELFQYLPLARTVFGIERISLNPAIQNQFFYQTEWGLASTGFGSLFISLNWLGVMSYLLFVVGFCFLATRLKSFYSSLLYFFIAPYFLFYFHRNDWHFAIGVLKLAAIALAVAFVGEKFLSLLKSKLLPYMSASAKVHELQ